MNLVNSREQIYAAVLAYVQAIAGIKTVTRKLKQWQETPVEDQPAIYIEQGPEDRTIVRGQPPRIVLNINLWVYVSNQGDVAGYVLNPILDAIDKAFEPKNDGDHVLTLGGIVHHCWVEGQTHIFEGNLGTEAVAIVPVKVLVT